MITCQMSKIRKLRFKAHLESKLDSFSHAHLIRNFTCKGGRLFGFFFFFGNPCGISKQLVIVYQKLRFQGLVAGQVEVNSRDVDVHYSIEDK